MAQLTCKFLFLVLPYSITEFKYLARAASGVCRGSNAMKVVASIRSKYFSARPIASTRLLDAEERPNNRGCDADDRGMAFKDVDDELGVPRPLPDKELDIANGADANST